MLFNSYGFMLAFLPVYMTLYYLVRHYTGQSNGKAVVSLLISLGSMVFCCFLGYKNVLVLILSILWNCNVVNILRICRIKKQKKDRYWLIVGVTINILFLCFFKYQGTFFPVAISFYTFNQISFLVDFYKRDIEEFDALGYLGYILFFPKFLQGPLMGYRDYSKELDKASQAHFDPEVFLRALLLISFGLFKKVILADTFGKAVDYGFDNAASLGSLEAILVAVFYSFQLYFDFSGYCDVASGICRMMGFELSLNFDSPYKAVNIIDFWKRWHITLTKFFTKYVYIPLGGNRKGRNRMYVNFLIVFFLSGLWHGNGWTFVIWGMMHGVLYVITRFIHDRKKVQDNDRSDNPAIRFFKTLLTFIYVTIAWVFFRAETISEALTLLSRVFAGGNRKIATGLASCFQLDEIWYIIKVTPIMKFNFAWDTCLWLFVAAGIGIIFFGKSAVSFSKECRIGIKTTLLTAVLLAWSIVSFAGVSTYLYMNF